MDSRVEALLATARDARQSGDAREGAIVSLRSMAQGSGRACADAKEALALIGKGVEHRPQTNPLFAELLDRADVTHLVDVPEDVIMELRREYGFTGDVEALARQHSAALRLKFWEDWQAETDPDEKALMDKLIDVGFFTNSETGRRAVAECEIPRLRAELTA